MQGVREKEKADLWPSYVPSRRQVSQTNHVKQCMPVTVGPFKETREKVRFNRRKGHKELGSAHTRKVPMMAEKASSNQCEYSAANPIEPVYV